MTRLLALTRLNLSWSDVTAMHRDFIDAINRANQELIDSFQGDCS